MKLTFLTLFLLFLCPLRLAAQEERCELFNEQGDSLLNLGRYDEAILLYQKAEEEARRLKRNDLAATTLTNQGVAYRLTERPDSALSCYQRALTMAQASGDQSEISHVLCSIAILYANTARRDEAETYARRAVEAAHASKDIDMVMYCDYTCGSILTLQGKYEEAIGIIRRMVGEAGRCHKPNFMLKGYAAIIDYFLKSGAKDSTLHYISKADALLPKVDEASAEALGYLETKAQVLQEMKHYEESLQVQQHLLKMREKGLVIPLDALYISMARNCMHLHRSEDAANFYELALAVKDSVSQSAINEQLSEFSAQLDAQQKELEIARLSASRSRLLLWLVVSIGACSLLLFFIFLLRRNARQRSVRRYLDGVEEERDRLGRELHDGIAGDLLGLSMQVNQLPADETATLLKELHEDVRRISHELLPPRFRHARLSECMADYLRHVPTASLKAEDGVTFPPDVAYQLYRILQESITNIRKHARASYVRVSLSRRALVIENDGVTDERSEGAGQQNIQQRADAIHASVTKNTQGDKCTLTITLK
ncbi:MAG: tetratricopeptide repeat protein [Alloprevotella sp.]